MSDDAQGTTVYPDIIVHKRGERRNLLAVEIKKSGDGQKDLRKLSALRHELEYQCGLFLRFNAGADGVGISEVRWSVD